MRGGATYERGIITLFGKLASSESATLVVSRIKELITQKKQVPGSTALLVAISACMPLAAMSSSTNSSGYALKGTLVTPAEIIGGGTILIVGDKIKAIGKDVQLPAVQTVSELFHFTEAQHSGIS